MQWTRQEIGTRGPELSSEVLSWDRAPAFSEYR